MKSFKKIVISIFLLILFANINSFANELWSKIVYKKNNGETKISFDRGKTWHLMKKTLIKVNNEIFYQESSGRIKYSSNRGSTWKYISKIHTIDDNDKSIISLVKGHNYITNSSTGGKLIVVYDFAGVFVGRFEFVNKQDKYLIDDIKSSIPKGIYVIVISDFDNSLNVSFHRLINY